MAEISAPAKPVHELLEKCDDNVPDMYILREKSSDHGPTDLIVPPTAEIPVIDVSKLLSSSSSAMDAELLKLREAISSWGCFQAINHGIEHQLIDEMRQVVKEFLNLPMEEKQRYARSREDPDHNFQGYGHDMVQSDDSPLDWNQRLLLFVIPEDVRQLQYWPKDPHSFRNVLHEYSARVKQIHERLLKSIARSLTLPEDSFLKQFGERGTILARFNYYPPCSRHGQVIGLKPHADVCGLTILLQDEEVQGLHIQKDNQWYSVPIMPYAFLVNAGEQLEIMGNGIIKAPIHRAVINPDKARNSLALFYSPDPAVEVGPVDELVDDKRPPVFKKVTNYPETFKNLKYYQQGISALDSLRV